MGFSLQREAGFFSFKMTSFKMLQKLKYFELPTLLVQKTFFSFWQA
jgi:hypothetical protein